MVKRIVLTLAFVTLSANVTAHHGTSTFDHDIQFDLIGVATDIAFVNPHSYLYMNVVDENGATNAWRCEMRAATVLRRSGWTKEMFLAGRELKVTGSPARAEAHTCYVNTIEFADGTTADRYSQLSNAPAPTATDRPARLASGVPNIAGDWAAEQRVQIDPQGRGGRPVALSEAQRARAAGNEAQDPGGRPGRRGPSIEATEAGLQAGAGYNAETDNPRFQCQPTNIFADWTFDQHINQIIQSEDAITLNYGFMDLFRTIHTNMPEHPGNIAESRAGHSIGRWEDDVLVVDTIGFAPGYIDGRTGTMHSNAMHVVERFTYDHDAKTLARSWVAEDPLYFSGQYAGQDVIAIADLPYEPYNCDDRTWQDSQFDALESEVSTNQAAPQEEATPRPWWKFWD